MSLMMDDSNVQVYCWYAFIYLLLQKSFDRSCVAIKVECEGMGIACHILKNVLTPTMIRP